MVKTAPVLEEQRFNPGDLEAFNSITNIDRRKCQRMVPLRVLGLGLSRTGTASMRQALIDLGYNDCYHFASVLQENPSDSSMWIEAMEAKFEGKGKPFVRADWDQLLGHCQATTDNPTVAFYKELLEAYPDAKVVVTVRDNKELWQQSFNATIGPYYHSWISRDRNIFVRLYRTLLPIDRSLMKMCRLVFENDPIYSALQSDFVNGTRNASKLHDDYINELEQIVPKEKLLIMNVKEGWEPLCKFLGEEIPLYPFPRKNDTLHFQRNQSIFTDLMTQTARWVLLKTAGAVVVGVLGVGLAARHHNLFSKLITKVLMSK